MSATRSSLRDTRCYCGSMPASVTLPHKAVSSAKKRAVSAVALRSPKSSAGGVQQGSPACNECGKANTRYFFPTEEAASVARVIDDRNQNDKGGFCHPLRARPP